MYIICISAVDSVDISSTAVTVLRSSCARFLPGMGNVDDGAGTAKLISSKLITALWLSGIPRTQGAHDVNNIPVYIYVCVYMYVYIYIYICSCIILYNYMCHKEISQSRDPPKFPVPGQRGPRV